MARVNSYVAYGDNAYARMRYALRKTRAAKFFVPPGGALRHARSAGVHMYNTTPLKFSKRRNPTFSHEELEEIPSECVLFIFVKCLSINPASICANPVVRPQQSL